jgi:hypothetical protein
VPLAQIAGWKGAAAQLACAICHAKTTSVCIECSGPDAVVALCKRVHCYKSATIFKQCLKRHQEDPESARRSHARSTSGKKRARN